ncbi:alpha/beta fold hydrolase [Roseateles amylovorans]|uniref:Alpha/beta hydrolase n=1 Tax=Roseateles amylovorans TaxID=2978473 RepID=A0ABY6B6Q1_9BURK|nr:alpha/beta hydrolase [Roseateles amylovorans]UXH79626.1 alpha/beta hydrolase [Roseateles amylovorans]
MSTAYDARRPHRSEFLTLRGLRHHVMRWGPPPDGSRPLLVMLHGWMDVGASFQFMVDAFREDRSVLAMDWRGFGLTDSSGGDAYWFPDYLGDLDALLDAVSPDAPVDLLGHSMGGNIVMTYAGVRPQRLRKLINLEGFGLPETIPEMAPARLAEWLDELKQPQHLKTYDDLGGVVDRLMKTNPRLAPDKAAWLAPHWSQRRDDGRWHILGDPAHKRTNPVLYRRAEALACWSRIEAPTLWVEGSETNISQWWGNRYPREDFETRLSVVPQLQRVTLQQAGHMLHHDQPDALAREVQAFLG